MKSKPELIAPAGSIESLFAAFQYGADAVYLGVEKLHARAQAHNFTIEELKPIINYAHINNKKIYAALNVLIKTQELDEVFDTLSELNKINIDAIIIQDLGLYKILKDYFPKLPVHFSTQAAIHNVAGIQTAERMGIKRVILARELTLKEIEYIRENTSLELEVFIHGARCYSYSGLCLFSSLIGGRSGNRGYCAQPCRKNYTTGNKSGYFFSMCDLFTLKDIPKLIEIGIGAFKIEGRLKSPLYTAYTSSIYKKAINNEHVSCTEAENILKTIYSREMQSFPKLSEGEITTDPSFPRHLGLHIGNILEIKYDPLDHTSNLITFITKSELERFDGIAIMDEEINAPRGCSIREIKVNKKNVFCANAGAKVTIKIPFNAKKGSNIYLSSKSSLLGQYQIKTPGLKQPKTKITININIRDNEFFIGCGMFNKSYPITTDKSTGAGFNRDLALKYFSKTGDTPFELENIEINAPEDIFIPPKEINHIRREFFKVLTEYTESVFQKDSPKVKFEYPSQLDFETEKERFSIKIDNPDYIKPALNEADRLIIELSINMLNNIKQTLDIIRPFNSQTILFSLPPIIRQEHIPMYVKAIDKYLISSGYSNFQISNLFGLEIFRCKDITLTADFPLYIFNHLSYQTLNKLGIKEGTISPELNKAELDKIIPIIKNRCDLILYSDLPYFYSANCTEASIRGNCLGKKTCGFSQIQFKNFEGDTFIAENNSCTTILINKKAFSLSRHLNYFKQLGQKMFRIDFLYKKYTAQEIKEIIRHVKSGKRIENTIEGNHERELF